MSCDWEGNRRFGVALAMHHRLKWFIHLWARGLSKGDENPPRLLMGYGNVFTSVSSFTQESLAQVIYKPAGFPVIQPTVLKH